MEETALIANLPNLEIKVAHRADAEEGAEVVAIQIKAFPSFKAVAGELRPALAASAMMNPLLMNSAMMNPLMNSQLNPWLAPVQLWATMAERMWGAWLGAAGRMGVGGR